MTLTDSNFHTISPYSAAIHLWIQNMKYFNISVEVILKNICARSYIFVSRLLAVVDWGLCCTLDITLGWHDSPSLVNNRKVGTNNNQLSNVFGSKTDLNSFTFGTRTFSNLFWSENIIIPGLFLVSMSDNFSYFAVGIGLEHFFEGDCSGRRRQENKKMCVFASFLLLVVEQINL